MIKCNRCGLKLGIFKRKCTYEESGDNAVILCSKCYEICVEENKENLKNLTREEERKNKEIIDEYLTKYLSSREWNANINISSLYQDKNKRKLFADNASSLENAREQIESNLEHLLSLTNKDSGPEQNNEILEEIEKCEEYIELFDDLERLYKLLDKKGIKTSYLELIALLSSIIMENYRKIVEEGFKPFFAKILNKLGESASKEVVIKEWLTIMQDVGNHPFIISVLLDKFNIKHEIQELDGLVNQLNEEVDLEMFEKNLESPGKIKIEELSKLSGHELEKNIEVLFCQLGWEVQESHLSDNKNADLLVTEDDKTIAVRVVIGIEQVAENEIQKVVALEKQYHVDKGMVVTDSIFTNKAIECSISSNIELWDGRKLRKMLRKSKPSMHDMFLNQTAATLDQLDLLLIECPFCESEIQIEQEKLPEKGEQHFLNCPVCGMELGLSTKPEVSESKG
jgi:hypothetical protein